MQAYGPVFAQIYDRWFGGFARHVAPAILAYHERAGTPAGERPDRAGPARSLLDLGCGTGELACYFLDHGYRVVGVDLSEAMLERARDHAGAHVAAGRATFVVGDAARFSVAEPVGLAVATYDALNHLESLDALHRCFACVDRALLPGGSFVFDLNTRRGLRERWNQTYVQEDEDTVTVVRGVCDDAGDRATMRVLGFTRGPDGRWERFEETVVNTVYDLAAVQAALLGAGWAGVHFARVEQLDTPLAAPEDEGRVFVVAEKRR